MSSQASCSDLPAIAPAHRNPGFMARFPLEKLGRPFWVFFAAAFFLDFGFDLYFFLYNLFLTSLHYDERAIGVIGSALSIGNLAGSIPIGILARRFGLQKMLLFCFIAAPIISICRVAILTTPAQIVLAFFTGVALSSWPVCFAPAVAKLTSDETRVFAFSITFATGIGTGTLAGLAGGYIPLMFHAGNRFSALTNGMRFVLIGASLLAMLGAWPIAKLKISSPRVSESRKGFVFHPFLLWFLPAFALWSIVTGSFIPFAPVFFQKQLGIPLQHVGEIFSASEFVQFSAVLLVPFLYRRLGETAGILIAQFLTAAASFSLGHVHSHGYAIALYLALSGAQFTAGPGFYGMLMSRIPERDRSSASALQNIAGALSQAGSATLTGTLIVRSGYNSVFNFNALLALLASLMLVGCMRRNSPRHFCS